jgi:hypothetical protein
MRKTGMAVMVALLMAAPAMAQSKLTGSIHCAKADPDYAIPVGDKDGHMVTARKNACTWTGLEIAGMAVKAGEDVATGEVNGTMFRDNGYHTATADNGDKFTVHFTGTATMAKDNSGSITGKWNFVSGTGKLKGIKGGGIYKGKANADGTADVTVEGDYTIAASTTSPAKK